MRKSDAVLALDGVGSAKEKALKRLGIRTIEELINHFPRNYEERRLVNSLREVQDGESVSFEGLVVEEFRTAQVRGGLKLTKGKAASGSVVVDITFFNQPYIANSLKYGESYIFYGKIQQSGRRFQMTNPYFEESAKREFVEGIVPIYPLTSGMTQLTLSRLIRQSLLKLGAQEETLPDELIQQCCLMDLEKAYQNIHSPIDWEALGKAKHRLVFEELLCLSLGLVRLRNCRKQTGAVAYAFNDLTGFMSALPFSPTKAQINAIEDIARDVQLEVPMNRLLQGDVGSGKTVVATAGIYLTWKQGLQSAFMVPTDILARQHYKTLQELLKSYDIRIGLLTASLTAKEKREVKEKLKCGEIDLLIGTHAILSDAVQFANLSFVVTDEQHRFGVEQRASLLEKAGKERRPHVLVMSATPIPRTMALIIYGDLELSVLDQKPKNRKEVKTYLIGEDKRKRLNRFIDAQIDDGHGVYIVCPMVDESDTMELKSVLQYGAHLQESVFPHRTLAVLHGKLKAKEKETIMQGFMNREIDILVSTTVIEVGVDVPHASLMVIENADRFGLSQLHQLRGRVGRGEQQSYCVLLSESASQQSRERLKALVGSNDGFQLAEEDLKQRGPGDFFGARQHGLPSLKVSNLVDDMDVLAQARQVAIQICEEDSDLSQAKYSGLKRKVQVLFDEYGDSFN